MAEEPNLTWKHLGQEGYTQQAVLGCAKVSIVATVKV